MSDGTVQGLPGGILRLEGAALLVASVLAYAQFGQGWELFAVLILAPDLSMIGYLRDPKLGAMVYNLAHIGMDRAVGYGLK